MKKFLFRDLTRDADCCECVFEELTTQTCNKHLFYARYVWDRDKWKRRTVERNEKRGKLGNYSHLCDAKECNVGVCARLRGNYDKSHEIAR